MTTTIKILINTEQINHCQCLTITCSNKSLDLITKIQTIAQEWHKSFLRVRDSVFIIIGTPETWSLLNYEQINRFKRMLFTLQEVEYIKDNLLIEDQQDTIPRYGLLKIPHDTSIIHVGDEIFQGDSKIRFYPIDPKQFLFDKPFAIDGIKQTQLNECSIASLLLGISLYRPLNIYDCIKDTMDGYIIVRLYTEGQSRYYRISKSLMIFKGESEFIPATEHGIWAHMLLKAFSIHMNFQVRPAVESLAHHIDSNYWKDTITYKFYLEQLCIAINGKSTKYEQILVKQQEQERTTAPRLPRSIKMPPIPTHDKDMMRRRNISTAVSVLRNSRCNPTIISFISSKDNGTLMPNVLYQYPQDILLNHTYLVCRILPTATDRINVKPSDCALLFMNPLHVLRIKPAHDYESNRFSVHAEISDRSVIVLAEEMFENQSCEQILIGYARFQNQPIDIAINEVFNIVLSLICFYGPPYSNDLIGILSEIYKDYDADVIKKQSLFEKISTQLQPICRSNASESIRVLDIIVKRIISGAIPPDGEFIEMTQTLEKMYAPFKKIFKMIHDACVFGMDETFINHLLDELFLDIRSPEQTNISLYGETLVTYFLKYVKIILTAQFSQTVLQIQRTIFLKIFDRLFHYNCTLLRSNYDCNTPLSLAATLYTQFPEHQSVLHQIFISIRDRYINQLIAILPDPN